MKFLFSFFILSFSINLGAQSTVQSLKGPEEIVFGEFYENDDFIFLNSGLYLYRSKKDTIEWEVINIGMIISFDVEDSVIVLTSFSDEHILYLSFDSGNNWDSLIVHTFWYEQIIINNGVLYVSDESQSNPYFFASSDYGITWDSLQKPTQLPARIGKTNGQIYFEVNGKIYLRNKDNEYDLFFDQSLLHSDNVVDFKKIDSTYIVKTSTEIWTSFDFGNSWVVNNISIKQTESPIRHKNGRLFTIGTSGSNSSNNTIFISDDYGKTWTDLEIILSNSVMFISDILPLNNMIIATSRFQLLKLDYNNKEVKEFHKMVYSSYPIAITSNDSLLIVATPRAIHQFNKLYNQWKILFRLDHTDTFKDVILTKKGTIIALTLTGNAKFFVRKNNDINFSEKQVTPFYFNPAGMKLFTNENVVFVFNNELTFKTIIEGDAWSKVDIRGGVSKLKDNLFSLDLKGNLLKSYDNGKTFIKTGYFNEDFKEASIYDINNEILLLHTKNGISSSLDGEKWNKINYFENKEINFHDRISTFKFKDLFYLSTWGIFASSQNGIDWTYGERLVYGHTSAHNDEHGVYLGSQNGGVFFGEELFLNVNNLEEPLPLKIYPNPTKDILNIEYEQNANDLFFIHDNMGSLIWQGKANKILMLNKASYSDGMYHLSVMREGVKILNSSFIFGVD